MRPSPPPLRTSTDSDPTPDSREILPSGWYPHRGRRCLDFALLLICAPAALTLMVLIGALNLIAFGDPGKVIFEQIRVGRRGRPFRIYKFRTMRELPMTEMESWSSGEDRLRVTRFGRLLRNTHLDELPQLINILKGDMGFIGPRPEMTDIERWAEGEVPGFSTRLVIRPGLTGLAQITQGYTGRNLLAYTEKLLINRWYLEHVTFGLDLWIVYRTVLWMLCGKGSRHLEHSQRPLNLPARFEVSIGEEPGPETPVTLRGGEESAEDAEAPRRPRAPAA